MEYGKQLSKIRVGSHLYGLQRPESDEDYMGVFMPKAEYLLGLKKVEEVDMSTKKSNVQHRNTSDDIDYKSYSLHKFMHLLLQNNPNIVEVLFASDENLLVSSPEWEELVANYERVMSSRVYHTFTGYAYSQKKKVTVKAERYNSLCSAIDYTSNLLYDAKVKYIDEVTANLLNDTVKYYKGSKQNCESFHKGMSLETIHNKFVEERDNYGWRVNTDTFLELGYDVKYGYHLIRILAEGYELLSTGKLEYPISGEAREDILRVRNGEVELEELYSLYDKWKDRCDNVKSVLPKKPDFNWANEFVVEKTLSYISLR
jgi:hypothetical protein